MGPLDVMALRQLHEAGVISDATEVAKTGTNEWSRYPDAVLVEKVICKKQPFVGRIGLFFAQLTQGGFARIPTLIRHNCSTGWFFVIETGLNSGFLLHVRAVEH